MSKVVVIIPAFNEERAIGNVIDDIPKTVSEIIVVDNGSTDSTATVASNHGATVLAEPRKGYGWACLAGIDHAKTINADILVFLDGDYSDFPSELNVLIEPILTGQADFVLGSRVLGNREKGSLTPQQVFGNWLATSLIKVFYKKTYTDLGPFRAIKMETLSAMNMQDKTFGWTIEMQLKAAKMDIATIEVPVSYRVRIGVSKVSGTMKGTIMAGYKILSWIFKYY